MSTELERAADRTPTRAGWVSVEVGAGDDAPVDLLCDSIDESYRLVATKRLVAELDRRQDAR
jgi:predicted DNA-binding protein (MmcQ/YjbR family)